MSGKSDSELDNQAISSDFDTHWVLHGLYQTNLILVNANQCKRFHCSPKLYKAKKQLLKITLHLWGDEDGATMQLRYPENRWLQIFYYALSR